MDFFRISLIKPPGFSTALGDPDPAPPGGSDLQSPPGDSVGNIWRFSKKTSPRTIVNLWLMVINYSYNMVNHYSMINGYNQER